MTCHVVRIVTMCRACRACRAVFVLIRQTMNKLTCTSLVFRDLDLHQSQEQLLKSEVGMSTQVHCGDAPEHVSRKSRLS